MSFVVVGLSLSPISSGVKFSEISSVELSFEQSEVLSLDWIDGAEHIPVDTGCARWSCHGPSVDPSVVPVHNRHEVTEGGKTHGRTIDGEVVELESIEEGIDHSLLGVGKLGSVFLD